MKSRVHPIALLLALIGGSAAFAGSNDVLLSDHGLIESSSDPFQLHSLIAWDSRYGAEGRDSLDGDGLASILLEMELNGWRLGSWFAESAGADYEERNFYVERDIEWRGFEAYLGYKFLQFPGENNEADHEFGAGVSGPELTLGLVPEINWYYSDDAGGSYLDAGLTREFYLTDRLHFIPSIFVGRNDGYISDGHPGTDHVRIALEAHYQVNERLTIQAHLGRSIAIDSNPGAFAGDALLRNFSHGGIGLSLSF